MAAVIILTAPIHLILIIHQHLVRHMAAHNLLPDQILTRIHLLGQPLVIIPLPDQALPPLTLAMGHMGIPMHHHHHLELRLDNILIQIHLILCHPAPDPTRIIHTIPR